MVHIIRSHYWKVIVASHLHWVARKPDGKCGEEEGMKV